MFITFLKYLVSLLIGLVLALICLCGMDGGLRYSAKSTLGFYRIKARKLIRSPYELYKFLKPNKKYIDKYSFDDVIRSALFYLYELHLNHKNVTAYEYYIKYISDICKYVDSYIESAKLDNDTKQSDDEYREYISAYTRAEMLRFIWLELPNVFTWKEGQEEFLKFLYSLKPRSCSPITEEDYDNYNDDDKWLSLRDNSNDFNFIHRILLFENKMFGKESRLLLTS